jgi:hypothetical protein
MVKENADNSHATKVVRKIYVLLESIHIINGFLPRSAINGYALSQQQLQYQYNTCIV